MSLEAEAMKGGNFGPRRAAKPPGAWDWFVRVVATILLLGVLTVVYWIPMELLGGFAAALVLAALTMLGAGVASRLYHLRIRVEALEAALDAHGHVPTAIAPPGSALAQPSLLEEVEKQP